jgi:hypothetical protein
MMAFVNGKPFCLLELDAVGVRRSLVPFWGGGVSTQGNRDGLECLILL